MNPGLKAAASFLKKSSVEFVGKKHKNNGIAKTATRQISGICV